MTLQNMYYESITLIERIHRLFLKVIELEIDRMNLRDINNVQCVLLYNIGEGTLSVGELTSRGYYMGSNVSYNVRKLLQNNYILQEPSLHDRRSSMVKLSKKGLGLYKHIDGVMQEHARILEQNGFDREALQKTFDSLCRLENFWSSLLIRPAFKDYFL